MNKPIRTISMFCTLLFVALMVNATYLQFWRADSLDDDPRNRRVIEASYSRERGAILVGRSPIAESLPVDDEYEFQRTYEKPFVYAPITGFFSFYTQTGLEQTQNEVLSGDDPRLFVTKLVDLLSNEANKGGTVQLTIDPEAQQAAYDGLLDRIGPEGEGSVVAIEPSTGKILAMVSLPSYDPNSLASHDLTAVSDTYDRLLADESDPLVNRGIAKTLPPGSTFKLVTAAAAIESGQYDASSDVPAGATYQLPLTSGDTGLIDNDGRTACDGDRIPFTLAMANSCNTTFARLAVEVGAEAMLKQAEGFGFNQDYLEDLRPQAESVFPLDANEPETGQTGIGQFEVRATPLQMAMVAAGIANAGVVKRPYLVDEVQSAEYDVLEKTDDSDLSQAVSSATADDLTELLVETVENGTASPARIPGVTVAGKTGTAQSGVDDIPPYAWFVSFAPAEDADVAVAVVIEEADVPRGEIAGGLLGGPIAKAVMQAVLQ
ncbi:MAG: penicillin-binding protein 2 [Nocardioides sp.]